MKIFLLTLLITLNSFVSLLSSAADAARVIELKTEKKGEVMHWMPEQIEVKAGEKIKIVAKHDLEGGFDFHGLSLPELKISESVQRHVPLTIERTISLKPDKYKIGCQFHPKHEPVTLIVK